MLDGKNIVITGCLQDIGRETLRVFAEHGANVFACVDANEAEFVNICDELATKNHVRIMPVFFDILDNSSIEEAAKAIREEKMVIHGLVNIAGIDLDESFGMISYHDMLETFQMNVFSQILFSQCIVRFMLENGIGGSVAFTSSITAMDGDEGQTIYGASKAALIGAMKSMAIELGKSGIRVNAVLQGVINSPMIDNLRKESLERKISRMEIPRLGEAKEVAELYMFLMSDLSSHVSGQTIRIDGGIG